MAKKDKNPNARPMTPPDVLTSLLNAARRTKKNVSELAGLLGEKISKAIENKHLHRKAFRAVVSEDRMELEDLAEFYDAQEYYRDVLGLNERAKSAPRLPVEGDEEEGGKKNSNVKEFPKQSSVAAE